MSNSNSIFETLTGISLQSEDLQTPQNCSLYQEKKVNAQNNLGRLSESFAVFVHIADMLVNKIQHVSQIQSNIIQ